MVAVQEISETEATTTMQAAIITGPQQMRLAEIARPEPGPGEVRVRLEGCGVCASNLPLWEGRPWFDYPLSPGAPGHEGWGRIDAIGPEPSVAADTALSQGMMGRDDGDMHSTGMGLEVGDRVALLSFHAYAQYDIAAADAVVKLPPELEGKPFPGEPLGCAMNVFWRSDIRPGQTVAIVGIGFLGALLTRLAALADARVIAISRRPFVLQLAREMGAAECILMDDHWQIIEKVRSLTGGRGCERVIEATGYQWPLDLAAEMTCERGRLVIAGYHQDGLRQINMQLWNWRGLDVINAHERDPQVYIKGIQAAVGVVAGGALDLSCLYTYSVGLDQLPDALECMRSRPDGFLKALVML